MSITAGTSNAEDFMPRGVLDLVQNGFFVDIRSSAASALPLIPLFREHGWRGVEIEADEVSGEGANVSGLRYDQKTRDYVAVGGKRAGLSGSTLSAILEMDRIEDLHFLSIDVSGLGGQGLLDIDLNRWRPWFLLIRDPEECASGDDLTLWARTLEKERYIPAYQSETNHFYIAMEQERLVKYFASRSDSDGIVTDGPRAAVSNDTGSLARHSAPLQRSSHELRSSIEMVSERLKVSSHEMELQIARIEIAQMRARVDAAEAWARSAANWVESAEARARSAESRANAAASWANRCDVRLRGVSQHLAEAKAEGNELRMRVIPQCEAEIGRLHQHIAGVEVQMQALKDRNLEIEGRIAAILNSTSWRVAAPLRGATHRLIRLPYRFIRRLYRRQATAAHSMNPNPKHQPSEQLTPETSRLVPSIVQAPVTIAPVPQPRRVRMYAHLLTASSDEKVMEQV